MANNYVDIIDLSDSFTLADHRALTNVVIELDTDDSIVELTYPDTTTGSPIAKQSRKSKKSRKNDLVSTIYPKRVSANKTQLTMISNEIQSKIGDCPICFDPLGRNPLASTKCGHVYCMKCIKQYLLVDHRCPTCRQNLKGKSSYHPLYLNS